MSPVMPAEVVADKAKKKTTTTKTTTTVMMTKMNSPTLSPPPRSAAEISECIKQLREMLASHRLYKIIDNREALARFMECHVFCVWDFMCLLKSLQRELTCVSVPWVPRGDAELTHFVNEMVIDEESDADADGVRCSHFEMYLMAMEQAGADTSAVKKFVELIRDGVSPLPALKTAGAPRAVWEFVSKDCELAEKGGVETAAAFTFGREDLIPSMFKAIVLELNKNDCSTTQSFEKFVFYLERHIEVDSGHHGPLALRLVDHVCNKKSREHEEGSDDEVWRRALAAARNALEMRIKLWDAVADDMMMAPSRRQSWAKKRTSSILRIFRKH